MAASLPTSVHCKLTRAENSVLRCLCLCSKHGVYPSITGRKETNTIMLLFKETIASIAVLMVALSAVAAESDESANLYLKASRSLPHVGRRSDFFLKTAKSVPRIGRRSDLFLKSAKSVPRIGRRTNLAPIEAQDGADWLWPGGSDAVPAPARRQAYYVRKDGQPVMWSDVARDVEENPDLWPWNDFDAGSMREVDSSR